MMKLFLNIPYIRFWIAQQMIKWMAAQSFYPLTKIVVPELTTWLIKLGRVSPAQLRRITLVALMHWFDYTRYFGTEFTTKYKLLELLRRLDFSMLLPFMIYNALSDNHPIENILEYRQALGGFPPAQINPERYLFNFIVENQKLKVTLVTEKLVYEFGEPLKIALTLQNLTDDSLTLENKLGPTVEFVASLSRRDEKEIITQSTKDNDQESNSIILLARQAFQMTWTPKLSRPGYYSIEAKVYVPHYDQIVETIIAVRHGSGEPFANSPMNFFTL